MDISDTFLKQALLEGAYIESQLLEKSIKNAKEDRLVLLDYLVFNDLITLDLIGQAIAEYLDVPYADLKNNPPSLNLLQLVPEELARQLRMVVYKDEKKSSCSCKCTGRY